MCRAGHNFHCLLISPLSVDLLINGTALIFHFENVSLTEERLFLSLFKASALKIDFIEFFKTLRFQCSYFFVSCALKLSMSVSV